MSKDHKLLEQLVESEIQEFLLFLKEQGDFEDTTTEVPPVADETGGDEAVDIGDTAGDEGGDFEDLGDEGGDLGADVGGGGAGDLGGEGGEDLGDDAGDMDLGGGGGFSGGGGGGFDFGGDDLGGDEDMEGDAGEEEAPGETFGPEDIEMPEDPTSTIVNAAITLSQETKNSVPVYNSAKGMIQAYFDKPDDAIPVVKALWDTGDMTLRNVARRLLMYIKGE